MALILWVGWAAIAAFAWLRGAYRAGVLHAAITVTGQSNWFGSYDIMHGLVAKGFDRSKDVVIRTPLHHLALLLLAPLPAWYGGAVIGAVALVVIAILLRFGAGAYQLSRDRVTHAWMWVVAGSFPLIAAVLVGDTHLIGLSAALLFVLFYYFAPSSLSYGFLAVAIALEPVTAILIVVPFLDGRKKAATGIAAGSLAMMCISPLLVALLLRLKAEPVILSALLLLRRTSTKFGFRVGSLTGSHSLWTPVTAIVAAVSHGRPTILVELLYAALVTALGIVAFWILHRAKADRRATLMVALALIALIPFDSTYAYALAPLAMIALFVTRSKPWAFERAYPALFALLLMPTDLVRAPLTTIVLGAGREASTVGLGSIVRPLALLSIMLMVLYESRSQSIGAAEDLPAQPLVLRIQPYLDVRRLISPRALGLLVVLAVTATSQLVMYNRYLPLQEGWFTVFAQSIIAGKVPYRDFYLFIPPVYAYVTVALVKTFGTSFIVFRTWGVVERILLAGALYLVLERPFKARSAAIATIIGVAVFASNNSDVIHGYTQFTLTLVLAATYLVMLAIERRGRTGYALVALAGVLGGIAFLTKQSLGLFCVVALVLALWLVFLRGEPGRGVASASIFVTGAAIPVVIAALWLQGQGALSAALGEIFGGASSKGSFFSILFGFIGRTLTLDDVLVLIALGLTLVVWRLTGRRLALPSRSEIENSEGTRFQLLCIGVAACLGSILPRLMSVEFTGLTSLFQTSVLTWEAAHWAFYYAVISTLVLLVYLVMRRRSSFARQLFVLSMVSFMASYAYGLSFSLDLASTVPAMSVAVAAALVLLVRPIEKHGFKVLAPLVLVFAVAIGAIATERYNKPYMWWGWSEPSLGALSRSFGHGPMRGMQVSANTEGTFERITGEIDRLTPKGSTMFTYPHVPIFYTLTERKPVTFGYVHYYDVMPDKVARADAARLLRNPPDSMVIVWFSTKARETNAEAFRDGKSSGQDAIESAVKTLLATGDYVAIDRSTAMDRLGDQSLLTVYVKSQYVPKLPMFDRPH